MVSKHNVQGLICGHIHQATVHDDFGIRYVNCGDWVESCTAIAEHHGGRLEIIQWTGEPPQRIEFDLVPAAHAA